MSGVRFAIGQAIAVVMTIAVIMVGIGLIVMPGPWFWFIRAGLGMLLCGEGLLRFSVSRYFTSFRQRLGLSVVRGMQLWCATYVAAGCLLFIGAVSSFEPVPAAIFAFAAFCWIWMWGWLLIQSRTWVEPDLPVPTEPGAPH